MQRAIVPLSAFAMAIFAGPVHAACPPQYKAIAEVAQTMRDMYTALTKDDRDIWRTAVAKDSSHSTAASASTATPFST